MKKVYCQNEDCGREITKEGGDVSSSGLIFCRGYKDDGESRCLDYETRLMFKGEISSEFLSYNTEIRCKPTPLGVGQLLCNCQEFLSPKIQTNTGIF